MIRALFAVAVTGVVAWGVMNLTFGLILPLLWFAVKVSFFVFVGYLVLRFVNPGLADKMKDKCTCCFVRR